MKEFVACIEYKLAKTLIAKENTDFMLKISKLRQNINLIIFFICTFVNILKTIIQLAKKSNTIFTNQEIMLISIHFFDFNISLLKRYVFIIADIKKVYKE